MPPNVSPILTPGEKRVMDVLWKRNHASVHEVHSELRKTKDIAYTTVLSVMRTMAKKGYVKYQKDGRAYRYAAAINESQARDKAIANLVNRFFDGSPIAFAQYLTGSHFNDDENLDALMAEVIEAERTNNDG